MEALRWQTGQYNRTQQLDFAKKAATDGVDYFTIELNGLYF
ncbi:hypothetical protein yfred0001_34190 [Yersinia frederiksenii ATCC 33641]|nr:hypothetical protein yfred0001_34190 [Yersinia frederiksenii ATCC 33641]